MPSAGNTNDYICAQMETISVQDYWYDLPEDRIAKHPLAERDASKLLVFNSGKIEHQQFINLPSLLPAGATLFFNNTKVIPARIRFTKQTGAAIEVFLINPIQPTSEVAQAMIAKSPVQWECIIGNVKRWKDEALELNQNGVILSAKLIDRGKNIVEFGWEPQQLSFAEMIEKIGETPLPPYLGREAEESDKEKYQTVYSKAQGAVAAPTAGLHFTDRILQELDERGIQKDFLTLHVSAGTFQPIKAENALDHIMHSEQMIITADNVRNLLKSNKIVSVGTTSMRTLESLYWYGVKLIEHPNAAFLIHQEDAYQLPQHISKEDSLRAILSFMERQQKDNITGTTSIFIRPGYQFRICEGLITNFHQPGSTLMLLVAAFVGNDWRTIYEQALSNSYRFLSFGDSSLLWKK